MGLTEIMYNADGTLNLPSIFNESWFFGSPDLAFLFLLFGAVLLLNRYGVKFGQLVGLVFALSLLFATMFGSLIAWAIVILVIVFSGLRVLQNILLRV